ncbi:MAG: hypothetical protein J5641_05560 [Bacteroidales bacterium]|nr:hypothetical protein [Bacteroidales bacterium]
MTSGEDHTIRDTLGGRMSGFEVRRMAAEMPALSLFECLYDADDRVARNAAWVLTHKPVSEISTLPQDRLIDLAITTPGSALRRLTLNLIEQQPMAAEEVRTDFLDFCLSHMVMLEEPPGVQSLCLKLAYRMCSLYPELMPEFVATLNLMPTEFYKPGLKYLIKKIKQSTTPNT